MNGSVQVLTVWSAATATFQLIACIVLLFGVAKFAKPGIWIALAVLLSINTCALVGYVQENFLIVLLAVSTLPLLAFLVVFLLVPRHLQRRPTPLGRDILVTLVLGFSGYAGAVWIIERF